MSRKRHIDSFLLFFNRKTITLFEYYGFHTEISHRYDGENGEIPTGHHLYA